jgi:hypothetical protein
MTVGLTVVLLLVAVVTVAVALRRREIERGPAALRLLAVLFAAAVAVAVFPAFWADSGAHAIWGLGLPVLVALAPVAAAGSRFGVVVTWLAAAFLLGWSLLFGLAFGLLLLPAALAETAAAVTHRQPRFT